MSFKYQRTENVAELLETLTDFFVKDRILLGHQNAGHIGVSINAADALSGTKAPQATAAINTAKNEIDFPKRVFI